MPQTPSARNRHCCAVRTAAKSRLVKRRRASARGCLVYYRDRGKTKEEMVAAIKVENVIDTTGCGDSFAGGVGYGLMQKPKDYAGAAKFGNALGALRTQGKTFSVFKPLDETKKIIALGYIRPS